MLERIDLQVPFDITALQILLLATICRHLLLDYHSIVYVRVYIPVKVLVSCFQEFRQDVRQICHCLKAREVVHLSFLLLQNIGSVVVRI